MDLGWRDAQVCWRDARNGCGVALAADAGNGQAVIVSMSQSIALAADQIRVDRNAAIVHVHLTNTTGAAIALASVPNIQPGAFDGQILKLHVDVGSNGVTLKDITTLAGSGNRLAGAADKTLGARDSVELEWLAHESVWLQSGNLVQA